MIGNIIFAFIFGIIIGYVTFLMKGRRDAKKSLKRITENNVGRFNLGDEITADSEEEVRRLQKEREKEMKGGKEKENGKNRKAVGLPKPEEGPTNPNNAK